MAKYICSICGYIYEGPEAPEKCAVCKAPSSKFTILNEGIPKATKLQKINEEDYEIIKIIESEGYIKSVEWYQENYDCTLEEAKEAIKAIRDKYNVKFNGIDIDPEALKYIEGGAKLAAVKVYVDKYGYSLKEAKDFIDETEKKLNGVKSNNASTNSNNGCMITILIAITTTLSAFWLL